MAKCTKSSKLLKCIYLIIREICLNGVLDTVKVTANELMEQIRPAKWLAERWVKRKGLL